MNRLLAVVVTVCLSSEMHATSLMNIGPLAKVKSVTVEEVIVGEALARNGIQARQLFDNAPSDLPKFREKLKGHLEKQLAAAGIHVVPQSGTSVMVAVYGGKYQDTVDAPNFFLVEISVIADGDCGPQPWVTKLGIATDKDLAQTLEEVITEEVGAFLEQRAQYLATLPKHER